MVSVYPSARSSSAPRFSSSSVSPFFVLHRTSYSRLLTIPHTRRKHAIVAYTVLSAHVDGGTGETFVAYSTIAEEGGMARSTAIEAVRALADHGLLSIEQRRDPKGDRATNRYTLHTLPAVAAADRGSRDEQPGVVRQAVSIEKHQEQTSRKRAVPVESKPLPMREILSEERTYTEDATDANAEQFIVALATDLRRQLRDKASARATTGRLRNSYRMSGLPRERFLDAVYEARTRTMRRGGGVAYWFQVLDDVLNAGDQHATPRPTSAVFSAPIATHSHQVPPAPITAVLDISLTRTPWPSELSAMGIPDVPAYIRRCGRGPFFDPLASIDFARRKMAQQEARR